MSVAYRQTQTLTLVLQDGDDSPAIVPFAQDLTVAAYEDVRVPYAAVWGSSGLPANLTGGTLQLTMRLNSWDPSAIIARPNVSSSISGGYFPIASADNALDINNYRFDVTFTDSTGEIWKVLPASNYFVVESDYLPSDIPTVPTPTTPIGQGPPGYTLEANIIGGCAIGDSIVFDTTLAPANGAAGYRALKNGGFTVDAQALVGWATSTVIDGAPCLVQTYGLLTPSVTGLVAGAGPTLTVDLTTGLIRTAQTGEIIRGYADANGNAHMLAAGFVG